MATKKVAKKNKLRKDKKTKDDVLPALAGGPGAPPKPPQG